MKNTNGKFSNKSHDFNDNYRSIEEYINSLNVNEKSLVKELVRLKTAAQDTRKLKEEFMAQLSHEIRTPLNIITNYTAMLEDEMEERGILSEFEVFFNAIKKGSNRIIRTIDLIINFSQIENNMYEPRFQEIDLFYDALDAHILQYRKLAEEKGLKLFFNKDYGFKALITADLFSLSQIIDQLLSNAVKFTYKGSITVNLKSENGKPILQIIDTGIGMSEEYMKKLFLPFHQEDRGYTRKFDGNGLGLALAQKYCELNKITLTIESKKGEGTKAILKF